MQTRFQKAVRKHIQMALHQYAIYSHTLCLPCHLRKRHGERGRGAFWIAVTHLRFFFSILVDGRGVIRLIWWSQSGHPIFLLWTWIWVKGAFGWVIARGLRIKDLGELTCCHPPDNVWWRMLQKLSLSPSDNGDQAIILLKINMMKS